MIRIRANSVGVSTTDTWETFDGEDLIEESQADEACEEG